MARGSEVYILFADLKGFSKLSDEKLEELRNVHFPPLKGMLSEYIERNQVMNTWGDAIFATFADALNACEFSLKLRDFFHENRFVTDKGLRVQPRIACHHSPSVQYFEDPLTGQLNLLGGDINTTARIEPVTLPGAVFVTEEFRQMAEHLEGYSFTKLGFVQLAKNFGEHDLFRLTREGEHVAAVDELRVMNVEQSIPQLPRCTEAEEEKLKAFSRLGRSEAREQLDREHFKDDRGCYGLGLAQLAFGFGLYDLSLRFIDRLEKYHVEPDPFSLALWSGRPKLEKMKANCLSRLGRYEEAAAVMYSLHKSETSDADTRSMLAANYKRRAVFIGPNKVRSTILMEDLRRAHDIYLEAFRLKWDDYYPAINVAYLDCMLGGEDAARGRRLAAYIEECWGDRVPEDWYLDATVAETHLLRGDIDQCVSALEAAIQLHQPDQFQLEASRDQIKVYAAVREEATEQLGPVFELFDQYGMSEE